MSQKQSAASHEEIWDDSALIDSWNEALEEYKKYHSIHAKGGSIKDVESKSKHSDQPAEPTVNADKLDDASITNGGTHASSDTDPSAHAPINDTPGPPPPAFPAQAVLGSVRDENLKKLLMSWYYAGYYTGLFEGQQQAQQS